ncbi:MAG: class I SAM-dependent methyltransferase, partial [Alphaproteobacteria bacterium]|nr:class I SAM-dependent methyltransferase [Alphaproteobacteria bacterium]
MSEALFLKHHPISAHQHQQLRAYVALLQRWNARINLIGKSTTNDIWHRHLL